MLNTVSALPSTTPEPSPLGRRSTWGQARLLLGGRRRLIVLLLVSSVAAGVTESGVLAIVAEVAAALVAGARHVALNLGPFRGRESIGTLVAVAVGLAVARLVLGVASSYLPARIAADVQLGLRRDLFAAFSSASWAKQAEDREGKLQELMTNQAGQATQGAVQATMFVMSAVMFAIMVGSAIALNLLDAVAVLIAAGALSLLLRPLHSLGGKHGAVWSRESLSFASGVGEATRMAEDTKTFGVSDAQRRQITDLARSVQDSFFRVSFLVRLVPGLYQSMIYLVVVAGLAVIYAAGLSRPASLGAVVLVLLRAGSYGQQAEVGYQALMGAMPYVRRLQQAQDEYAANTEPSGGRRLPTVSSIKLESVGYAYRPDRPVLSEISFEVSAGEAIGVVGPSGAGKSTLIQILLGLRAPDRGRYLVNGHLAEDYLPADWHRLFAYVPQEPRLLHASVADNIRFLRDLDDASIEKAARLAHIHDDVAGWRRGYDTIIGPRADAVSGGQKQRICLARALAADPCVLVLDEPTSALDPQSEQLIQESLSTLKGDLTLIVVAHRMSTLEICQKVMVIVDGRLEAFEPASVLASASSYYRSAAQLASSSSIER